MNAARKMRRAAMRRVAADANVMSGCTCPRPFITVHGVAFVDIAHDPGCPMEHHPSQLVLFVPPARCAR